jgi:hypothetical protein
LINSLSGCVAMMNVTYHSGSVRCSQVQRAPTPGDTKADPEQLPNGGSRRGRHLGASDRPGSGSIDLGSML